MQKIQRFYFLIETIHHVIVSGDLFEADIALQGHWFKGGDILSKNAGSFVKNFLFLRRFLHIFATANQLPNCSVGALPNVEDFWNVNVSKID